MKVIEIFSSIEGEGKRAGTLCTFIRLAGCNLRCSYCDTTYSYDCTTAKEMTVKQVIEECKKYEVKNVTVTGGEPLIHENITELLNGLAQNGFEVNIETNGSIDITGKVDRLKYPSTFFTIDYKCLTSNVNDKMFLDNLKHARSKDVIKFVVGSKEDLVDALDVIKKFKPMGQIYFSPVWGQIEMTNIVDFMKEHKLNNCKIQVQLHKIIWDVNKRGV